MISKDHESILVLVTGKRGLKKLVPDKWMGFPITIMVTGPVVMSDGKWIS